MTGAPPMQSFSKAGNPPAEPEPRLAQTPEAIEAQVPVWEKPTLLTYGDIRQLTMGATGGVAESGPPMLLRN